MSEGLLKVLTVLNVLILVCTLLAIYLLTDLQDTIDRIRIIGTCAG